MNYIKSLVVVFVIVSQLFCGQVDLSTIKDWTPETEGWNCKVTVNGQEQYITKHGDFKGINEYWRGNWYPDRGDEPGAFTDSGNASAWGLINSRAFSKDGSDYQWIGWNSNAGKWHTESDGSDYGKTDVQDGDWGPQINSAGPGAYVPTWRDGAEGAYTISHNLMGKLDYDKSILPALEVARNHPRIKIGWGVVASKMDANEWAKAREMVNEGHEIINNSWDYSYAGERWQVANGPKPADCISEWRGPDTLSIEDAALPPQLRGLIVGDSSESYPKTIKFTIPYTRYENDDVTKPITLQSLEQTYYVSADYTMDTTYRVNLPDTTYETYTTPNVDSIKNASGWVDTIPFARGKVKPNSTTWYENGGSSGGQGPVLRVFCAPGWEDTQYDMYKVNIQTAKDSIDAEVYNQVNSPWFPQGFKTSYYAYPGDSYSKLTHDKLKEAGIIGARGGAKSGIAMPGDFYQPFRIDFDAFYMLDPKGEKTLSNGGNPYQRLSLRGMVETIVRTKGYMVRELQACVDVAYWADANDSTKGGSFGGIPKSLYEEHFAYLDSLIDEHKIVVFTPTEAVRYRLTANSVTGATLNGLNLTVTTDGSTPAEYQDEISVIVKFADAKTGIEITYKDGSHPRYKARKMDDEGKAWSVSVNPYKDNGEFTLNEKSVVPPTYTITSSTNDTTKGTLSPMGSVVVDSGANQIFTFNSKSGNRFDSLLVDGSKVSVSGSSYELNKVSSNHTIKAYFSSIPANKKKVTPTVHGNGTVSPNSEIVVDSGASQTITAVADSGWQLDSIKVGGSKVSLSSGSYTISSVKTDVTVEVWFSRISVPTYTVSSSSNDTTKGTISPMGSVVVDSGTNQIFTFNSKSGNRFDSLLVDGSKVSVSGSSYEFTKVSSNHIIKAYFSSIPASKKKVTPIVHGNGTVSPNSEILVDSGASQTITVVADSGWQLDSIKVGGSKVSLSSGSYTISSVKTDVTVEVWFSEIPQTFISADFNKDNKIDILDFAKVSEYWYNSADGNTNFVELAPDNGTFEHPNIEADGKFDYKDLNRFIQYCYYYDGKSVRSSILSKRRSTDNLPIKVEASKRNGKIILSIFAKNAEDISAVACHLAENDSLAEWREGTFINRGGESIAMRGKGGISIARVSDKNRSVSGDGLIATAEIKGNNATIPLEIVMVDKNGKSYSGLINVTVKEDNNSGVKMILAPNPFSLQEPLSVIVESNDDPIIYSEIVIFDALGNVIVRNISNECASKHLFKWDGVSSGVIHSGSFVVIAKFTTKSGKRGVLKDMLGLRR